MDLFHCFLKEAAKHFENIKYEGLSLDEKIPIWEHVIEQLGNAMIFESADMDTNIN